jgi:hypothetical protein
VGFNLAFKGLKYCSTLLETVSPRLPDRNFRDFSLFNADLKRRNCPSARCIRRQISSTILAFIYPCIASISLKYNQQDATFSRSIYFYKLLYMFQAVPPPIIRSTKLYIQPQVWQYLTLYVQFCAPDAGRRNRLKHVEQFIEINISRKRCILLVVL